MAGMLVVGTLMYLLMYRFGYYYVEGVGYATIQDVLSGFQHSFYLLLLLFAAKLLATSLTLGSGASGGVFSPALFLGATSGAAWGVALNHFIPALHVSPAAFAIAGMGAVVGGSTGAAMAAIVMIFEMTLDYTVIIPMTLTVAISYAVRRSLVKDSIYTRKLTMRGESVPETLRVRHPVLASCGRYYAALESGGLSCLGESPGRRCTHKVCHGDERGYADGRHDQDARE